MRIPRDDMDRLCCCLNLDTALIALLTPTALLAFAGAALSAVTLDVVLIAWGVFILGISLLGFLGKSTRSKTTLRIAAYLNLLAMIVNFAILLWLIRDSYLNAWQRSEAIRLPFYAVNILLAIYGIITPWPTANVLASLAAVYRVGGNGREGLNYTKLQLLQGPKVAQSQVSAVDRDTEMSSRVPDVQVNVNTVQNNYQYGPTYRTPNCVTSLLPYPPPAENYAPEYYFPIGGRAEPGLDGLNAHRHSRQVVGTTINLTE